MLSVNKKNNIKLVAEEIISRMLEAMGTDVVGLAEFLGNTPESISMWKTRSVPPRALIKVAEKTGKTVDWLKGQNVIIENKTYDLELQRIIDAWPMLCDHQKLALTSVLDAISKQTSLSLETSAKKA